MGRYGEYRLSNGIYGRARKDSDRTDNARPAGRLLLLSGTRHNRSPRQRTDADLVSDWAKAVRAQCLSVQYRTIVRRLWGHPRRLRRPPMIFRSTPNNGHIVG